MECLVGKDREEKQLRCVCNRLVCITNGMNIEIKCGKCKRLIVIKTRGITGVSHR
ncbi:MAG: hypothetical protein GX318_03905 [Clostridia bacterium]|mgnify:CR=1 FL=1|nr:hypothetical protein [Clostridia bacterium]